MDTKIDWLALKNTLDRRNFLSMLCKGVVSSVVLCSIKESVSANPVVANLDVTSCIDTFKKLAEKEVCEPDRGWIMRSYETATIYYPDLSRASFHNQFSSPIRFKFSSRKTLYLGNDRFMNIEDGVPFIDIEETPRMIKDVNLVEANRLVEVRDRGMIITPCGKRVQPEQFDRERFEDILKYLSPMDGKKITGNNVQMDYMRPYYDGDKLGVAYGVKVNTGRRTFNDFIPTDLPMTQRDFDRQGQLQ